MQKLKRGPPYDDDPGCKYIVIEDPWPGDKTGKSRDEKYYNFLCAWVRFMLGKAHEVECVYVVNTRNEVIVQLPKEADLVPIVGAHPWRRILSRGVPEDADRVSYVFAYDYRTKGDPAKHNWQEIYPTTSGDPPEFVRFPVVFPYPHVSYASPRNRNCSDLALPLPPVRQPTPIPDTSLFTPYQHPTQLTAATVTNAGPSGRPEQVPHSEQNQQQQPAVPSKLGKIDPYEEEVNVRQSLRHSVESERLGLDIRPSEDRKPKRELEETLRSEDSKPKREEVLLREDKKPKVEERPSGPSEAFIAAYREIRGISHSENGNDPTVVKAEAEQTPAQPSEAFTAAYLRIRGLKPEDDPTPHTFPDTVKAEPHASSSSPRAERRGSGVKTESGTHGPSNAAGGTPHVAPKRLKEEHYDGPVKRVKTEYRR